MPEGRPVESKFHMIVLTERCMQHTDIVTAGHTAVASAAPFIPRPMGNINT